MGMSPLPQSIVDDAKKLANEFESKLEVFCFLNYIY